MLMHKSKSIYIYLIKKKMKKLLLSIFCFVLTSFGQWGGTTNTYTDPYGTTTGYEKPKQLITIEIKKSTYFR